MAAADPSGANLPYATKYSKSRYTYCTKCNKSLAVDEVILGIRECDASGQFVEKWFHTGCFFPAMKAKGVGVAENAIRGMTWLKWDDQEAVRAMIEDFNGKSAKDDGPEQRFAACKVEHAKTSKAKCNDCKEIVPKDETKYYCKGAWYHLPCFIDLHYTYTGETKQIKGYDSLKQEEKDELEKDLELKRRGKKVKDYVKTEMKTEETQASRSDCSMLGGGEDEAGSEAASDINVDPLLAAARKMARKKKDAEIVLGASQPAGALPPAAAAAGAAGAADAASTARAADKEKEWADMMMEEEEDDDIQLVDVVKSSKPPVVMLGGGEEDDEREERTAREASAVREVEVLEEVMMEEEKVEEPAERAKPTSSLNDLFARFQQEDKKKRESLSSVMEILTKKPRMDEETMAKEELTEQLKKQANALWQLRDEFDRFKDKEIEDLMRANDMHVPEGKEKLVMSICDAALFGAPGQCPKCPEGKLTFSTDHNTYVCKGDLTEWTKCSHTNKNPFRSPLGFPRALAKKLASVEKTGLMNSMARRYYPVATGAPPKKGVPSLAVSAEVAEGERNKQAANAAPRYNFALTVNFPQRAAQLQQAAASSGKQFIKKGTVVDGECEVAQVAHVYRDEEGTLFSCSLTQADLATNRNSYFKMQLLQHDLHADRYFVFKSWGRVGTELGGCDTMNFGSIEGAKEHFLSAFLDKTGNEWADKKYFRKRPGKMAMVDMDYSEIEEEDKKREEVTPGSLTKLDKSVQALILRIFDEKMFLSALKSFDLDMDQMPLGKLSKKQLTLAYAVLNELQEMVKRRPERDMVIDATNRFYSLIPHNFGHRAPDMLDKKEIIEKKSKLIENLMDIAIAVDLMKDGDKRNSLEGKDPIDINYLKLKSEITPLPKTHPDFKMIEKYAKNTHGTTHQTKIQITEIFCVNREGEEARFNRALGNRMLLWHGSRLSNYVGIISQGLRIAPPEAPHAGYMFGKGIYFADMVSKSANYCHPNLSENDAFLLLCDVALGKVQEEHNATGTNPLKNGCNAVKGVGYQVPHPDEVLNHADGYLVPYGKGTHGPQRIYLEYNEFIVYDMSQVRIRYLVRTKMQWR